MKYKFTIYSIYNEYQIFKDEAEVARFLKENNFVKLSLCYKNNNIREKTINIEDINEEGEVVYLTKKIQEKLSDGNKYICLDDKGISYTNKHFHEFLILNRKEINARDRRFWTPGTINKHRSSRYAKSRNKLRVAVDQIEEWEDFFVPKVRSKATEQVQGCHWDDYYAKDWRYYRNIQKNWKKFRNSQYK